LIGSTLPETNGGERLLSSSVPPVRVEDVDYLEALFDARLLRRKEEKGMSGKKKNEGRNRRTMEEIRRLSDMTNISETNDAGDAVSEETLRDASGKLTGGGVDTPTRVEEATEEEIRRRKPINQGTNAYSGGGADNGTDLGVAQP
jgi:hypothetical protein